MDATQAIDIAREALVLVLVLATPILLSGLITALLVGLILCCRPDQSQRRKKPFRFLSAAAMSSAVSRSSSRQLGQISNMRDASTRAFFKAPWNDPPTMS